MLWMLPFDLRQYVLKHVVITAADPAAVDRESAIPTQLRTRFAVLTLPTWTHLPSIFAALAARMAMGLILEGIRATNKNRAQVIPRDRGVFDAPSCRTKGARDAVGVVLEIGE